MRYLVVPAKEKVDGEIPFTSRNSKLCLRTWMYNQAYEFAQGTWWTAFNSVTNMTDHLQGRSNDGRLVSSWYGRNRKVKLNVMDKAIEYVA